MRIYSNIAKRLDILRRKNALSWREFSEKAGISQSALTYYKRGRTPDSESLKKISTAFGVSIDYLLKGLGAQEIEKGVDKILDHKKPPLVEIAIRINQLMDKKGFSATGVARELGVSRAVVSNWLRAKNAVGHNKFKALASLLGVSPDFLATGREIDRHETIYMKPEPAGDNKALCTEEKLKLMIHDLTTDRELCENLVQYYEFLLDKKNKSGSGEGA